MSVLLICEVLNDKLELDVTLKALAAAATLGPVTALVAGKDVDDAARLVSTYSGVTRVFKASDWVYSHGEAEPMAELIRTLCPGFTHVVAPSTSSAKNILPRVAALLDVMIVSDVVAIVDEDTFERPIYAGNALQTVRSQDPIKVLTVRTANFKASEEQQSAAPIEAIPGAGSKQLSSWIEDKIVARDRPDLTSAKVVVSGGRGVGSEANFDLVKQLADKLGAAVGASRAAVDSGYASNDLQVGQTGKVVAPDLYIAVGISGAIQHLAGMKDSKIIVAINKDAEAPIFQVADFGLVGDLFDVVPELTSKLPGVGG